MHNFKPIIISLLDMDLYKFTMQQTILHRNPSATADYEFRCRNTTQYPLSALASDVEQQLDHLASLRFTADELAYLRTLRYLKDDYIYFLSGFRMIRELVTVSVDPANPNDLVIRISGPMLYGMMFEIFILAIVNELYFRQFDGDAALAEGTARLNEKISMVKTYFDMPDNRRANPFQFFEFGTRRRYSREWQEHVVSTLMRKLPVEFGGTSNVWLARKFGVTPIGTMAHEYLQAFQALGTRLRDFQKAALEGWVQEYRGDLGIALTDVVGMKAFLADFDLYFAKLFDGLRHDSGDPFEWGEMALAHYQKLKVNPSDKRLVFSDGLDFEKAIALYACFADRTHTGFGIGTNLTNDMGPDPLQIVLKMVRCNGQSVAKISDSSGKTMSTDETYLQYLRETFNIGS